MIITHSKKHHPEFDMKAACSVFKNAGDVDDPKRDYITSPYNLYSVEKKREKLDWQKSHSVPTDIFVFGKGEPKNRECTKLGGLPYWPLKKPWPLGKKGKPMLFLAQINFLDSMDIVGDIPGEILLLFVDKGSKWERPNGIHFEWVDSGQTPIEDFDKRLNLTSAGPFFGTIFRSVDYPDNRFLGTKIGGLPDFIQEVYINDVKEKFLCQLGSIQATPNVPYPWTNHPETLNLDHDDRGIYGDKNNYNFGDLGIIYIFNDGEKNLNSFIECY